MTHEIPKQYQDIMESQSEKDRTFFLHHPGVDHYYRDIAPGELWPFLTPKNARVKITEIIPGVRDRVFMVNTDALKPISGFENEAAAFRQETAKRTRVEIEQALRSLRLTLK